MDDYKKYLAENILSEDKVITYRLLSRALKVHVNIAKQMLYDFHEWQNVKRPGAVYATYLLYGTKQSDEGASQGQAGKNGDIEMANSMPEDESAGEVVPTLTLSLVPEERLKDALATYDEITSIHVYSLGPHPMKDMASLIDAAQQLLSLPTPTDSSGAHKTYGAIVNPHVRRRERRGAGAKSVAANAQKAAAKTSTKPLSIVKEEPKLIQSPPAKETAKETASAATAPAPVKKPVPTLKRGGSSGSGIMQSFAKAAAARAKKAEASQPATPSGDDSSMQPMSEGEEDDSEVLPQPKVQDKPGRKGKKEREEELRRMMEDDDEEGEEEEAEDKAPSPAEEVVEEPPVPEPVKEEPAEIISGSGGGRRRGKRRIMKKQQILDDQGYLVTIQEPGWESFSEDEAPPPASKPKLASSAPAAQATKAKKSVPKGSQGNIMSFFSKK